MKNLLMICLMGMSLVFGACAHKHGAGCADGSCAMKTTEKKDCGCDHKHEETKAATPTPTATKK